MRTRVAVDVPKLFRLWAEGKPSAQIGFELGITTAAVYQLAKQYALPRRTRARPQQPDDPTPEEIAERALAIREKNLAAMRAQP